MALCPYADVALQAVNGPDVEKTENKTQYVSILPDTTTEKTLCGGEFQISRIMKGTRKIMRRGRDNYSSKFEV